MHDAKVDQGKNDPFFAGKNDPFFAAKIDPFFAAKIDPTGSISYLFWQSDPPVPKVR